jgi:glycerophosphoryl diester phosphodiesterase
MPLSPFARLDPFFAPPPGEQRIRLLRNRRFAHRGLHGSGVVENSRAAFAAAIEAGDGIECDIQISRDGIAFVFHDTHLDRLTDASGRVPETDAAALDRIRLKGTGETIPRLSEMLDLVASRVPLLIEVKAPDRLGTCCRAVRQALRSYAGPVAIMSFNPSVGRWFLHHARKTVRGLVISEENRRNWQGAWERRLALWWARPDFIAYDVRDLPSPFASAQVDRGLGLASWTVRTDADERTARASGAAPIYEIAVP